MNKKEITHRWGVWADWSFTNWWVAPHVETNTAETRFGYLVTAVLDKDDAIQIAKSLVATC